MRNMVYPASVDDELTLRTAEDVWKKYSLHIDPHTAVAFAAAVKTAADRDWKGHTHTVILATGHYAKEAELIREVTGQKIIVPEPLQSLRKKSDPVAIIPPQLDAFEGAVASCF
jgi:threonine synthase